ncbi:MAG: DUF2065 domain-containing protein [Pseudomonadota bacterium]
MWIEILTAVSLFLVLEGLLPFISPEKYKQYIVQVLNLPDSTLRWFGLGSMLLGILLLSVVR